jgi:hypothetical protein
MEDTGNRSGTRGKDSMGKRDENRARNDGGTRGMDQGPEERTTRERGIKIDQDTVEDTRRGHVGAVDNITRERASEMTKLLRKDTGNTPRNRGKDSMGKRDEI